MADRTVQRLAGTVDALQYESEKDAPFKAFE
jgi:hypothetical protein